MGNEELDRIDAEIATKVMGWHLVTEDVRQWWEGTPGFCPWLVRDWRPTRNIAQAWEVLEKVGLPFGIHFSRGAFDCIIIEGDQETLKEFRCYGSTATLAIVLAALKSCGVGE